MDQFWKKVTHRESIWPWVFVPISFLLFGFMVTDGYRYFSSQPVSVSPSVSAPSPVDFETVGAVDLQDNASTSDDLLASDRLIPASHTFVNLQYKTIIEQSFVAGGEAKLRYPEFIGGSEVARLNQYVKKQVFSVLAKDLADVANYVESTDEPRVQLALDVRYKVFGIVNDVVSIEIIFTDFTLGGNGNHDDPLTINYDLTKDRPLQNKDLFCVRDYVSKLADAVHEGSFLGLHPTNSISDIDFFSGLVDSATSPDADNFERILLTKDGLVVVYPPYYISSGAAGIIRVNIPYQYVSTILCLPR